MLALFRCLLRVPGTASRQSAVGWELYPPCRRFFAPPWDNRRVGKSEWVVGQSPEPRRLVGRKVRGRI